MSCECGECRHIAAARGAVEIPSPGDPVMGTKYVGEADRLGVELHAARNELTRARLVLDLMAQRLGVPRTDEREPHYEWLLEAVEDLRERCGEIEPQGDRHGG